MSGNGQVTLQYFNTGLPLTIEARDANGNPVANLPLSWAVTQGQGTVVSPPDRTDSQGRAGAYFRGDVTPGYSFSQQTVTVSSTLGSVDFVVTTSINRLPGGTLADFPLVNLLNPPLEDRTIRAVSGSTLPSAIQINVTVQSGPQTGVPVPNVGMRVVDAQDPTAPVPARCANIPLTDSNGLAHCDLVLTGQPGTYSIAADVGEFRITPAIVLTIVPAASCNFSVQTSSTQFGTAAGLGSINVSAAAGCNWSAVSNVSWIQILSGASGAGPGGATFSVQANTGAARTGTIAIANQTVTITQAGVGGGTGPSPLSVVTGASLPSGIVGSAYNATLAATGGRAPYIWIGTAQLPAGLSLNPTSGTITGTPTSAGTYQIPITVTDQSGLSQSRTFTITITAQGGGGGGNPPPGATPTFVNTSFPNGTVGTAYQQLLSSAGGCATPFTAPPVYSLASGSLPPGLAVTQSSDQRTYYVSGTPSQAGTYTFTLKVTDPCGAVGTASFTMTVTSTGGGGGTPAGPVSTSPQSLTFTLSNGAAGTLQELPLTINGPQGIWFSAATTVTGGGSWLNIMGVSNSYFPATFTIRAAGTGAMSNGTYTGSVMINSSAGNVTVPVTLTVGGSGGGGGTPSTAVLSVTPATINYSVAAGSNPLSQLISVTNATGAARFTVQASTVNGGSWLAVSPAGGDTPSSLTAVLNPAGLQPSLYTGAIAITPVSPMGATVTIPVTLRVLPPAGLAVAPTTLSFQSKPGSPPPATQSLVISSTGVPFDSTVSANTESGGSWLYVSPMQGSTPINASVSVNPTGLAAGTYRGAIQVTPSSAGVAPASIPVTLTVLSSGPAITAITNAASFQPGPLAPGEIVTLFGSELGPTSLAGARVSQGRLESIVSETRVFFDDAAAPLIYTSANQVSAIVPYTVEGRATTKVSVEYRGVRSQVLEMRVVSSVPAIFISPTSGQAAALNENGSVNSTANGAAPGSIIVLYATGEGQTSPGGEDGKIAAETYPKPLLPVTVRINGDAAELKYYGAAPGMSAGVMQINAVIPKNVPRGVSVPVVLQVGESASPSGVTIAIKP